MESDNIVEEGRIEIAQYWFAIYESVLVVGADMDADS